MKIKLNENSNMRICDWFIPSFLPGYLAPRVTFLSTV